MYSLGQIAEHLGARLVGDPATVIESIKPLKSADSSAVAFFSNEKVVKQLQETNAAAVLLCEGYVTQCPTACLVVDNPAISANQLIQMFAQPIKQVPGIHSTAIVADTAQVDETATIGAYVVIGEHVKIGARSLIHPHVAISDRCSLGDDCILYPHVTLYADSKCSNRVIIHANTVIGSDGFGNTRDKQGWVKMPHIGGVLLEDDVEVGANSAIDRGVLEDTSIGKGVKLDNQVHIAHNVKVGAHTVMAAGTIVAGSTVIGECCMFGGMVGVADNLIIAANTRVMAKGNVASSLTKPGTYSSTMPCQPAFQWNKLFVHYLKIIQLSQKIRKLEKTEKA
jgi:UDP-3-O-[3-hydroxymyristoyl] glucosamine N-acyltransferase